jgi:hypothetical protein
LRNDPQIGAFARKGCRFEHWRARGVLRETDMADSNPGRKAFEAGAKTAREAFEKGTETAERTAKEAERSYSSATEGFRDFNAKLMDIAQSNTMANLNFLGEFARVKDPTEAFSMWSRHVQDHLQRLSEQSQELAALGQRIASSSAEPLRRGFDETFRRAS